MKTGFAAVILGLAAVALPLAAPAAAQSRADEARWEQAQRRFEAERALYERERERYEAARRDRYGRRGGYDRDYGRYGDADAARYETDYDAARYYRDDPRYQERVLGAEDEVYRGSDGRYYCRRRDGTIGLVVGAGVGGLLGNLIAPRGSKTVGTIIGAAGGAAIGYAIERQQLRCE